MALSPMPIDIKQTSIAFWARELNRFQADD